MELRLVADTNLFLEGRCLEELPWQELGEGPVILLVTQPVLEELDRHKNGSGRARRRALNVNRRLHPLLDGDEPELVVQEANPRVLLQLALAVGPAEDLRGPLDYGKNDHRLIGILATLMRHLEGAPDPSTMFFTNDRIANATARQLGLPVRRMGDHCKRPRQDDEEEDGTQEVRGLRAELAAYRAREPSIVIEHEGDDVVETVHQVARALTDGEVEGLVEELKAKHPLREDFTPPPPSARSDDLDALLGYSLEPPDEADVRRYRDEDYPRWIDACRGVLLRLHEDRRWA